MYRSELVFNLFGLGDDIVKLWESIEPLPNFAHYFAGDDVPDDTVKSQTVVFSSKSKLSLVGVRDNFGKDAVLIYCTDEPDKLTAAELAVVDDVWPLTMAVSMWQFRIGRLLRMFDERRKHYFYQHCLDTAINMLPDLIWFKDVKGSHLKVNDAFCECVAKPKDDVEGRGHYYIWGLTKEMYDQGEFVCLETEQEVLEKREICVFDEQVLDQNGVLRELKTWKAPIFDEDCKTLIGTVGIARDVTVENQQRRQIEAMAYSDYMTGVANRLAFYRYMEKERNGQPVTMLYFDADHFKSVNDTYGHKVGDEAIICMANILKQHFEGDFITRLGGDEFLVTKFGLVDKTELKNNLDKFMKLSEEMFAKDSRFKMLSMSIGVTQTADPNVWGGELIHESDMALYEAKRRGRHRYVFYDDMTEEMKQDAAGERCNENSGNRDDGSVGL